MQIISVHLMNDVKVVYEKHMYVSWLSSLTVIDILGASSQSDHFNPLIASTRLVQLSASSHIATGGYISSSMVLSSKHQQASRSSYPATLPHTVTPIEGTKAKLNTMASSTFFLLVVLALVTSHVIASDPSPLQDFCVADKYSPGIY